MLKGFGSYEEIFGKNKSPEVSRPQEQEAPSPKERVPMTVAEQAEKNKNIEKNQSELEKLKRDEDSVAQKKELLLQALITLAKKEPIDVGDLQEKLGPSGGTWDFTTKEAATKSIEDQIRHFENAKVQIKNRMARVTENITNQERS